MSPQAFHPPAPLSSHQIFCPQLSPPVHAQPSIQRNRRVNTTARLPPTKEDLRPSIGFTMYAEVINGRAAMIGFVSALLIELVAQRSLLDIWEQLAQSS